MTLNHWDRLIKEFSSLGGVLKNIYLGTGDYGQGLFPCNPTEPIFLFAPENILISADDIALENNNVVIKSDALIDQNVKDFFEFYQKFFSWGSQGRELAEVLEYSLNELSNDLKDALREYSICDLSTQCSENWDSVIFKRFLNCRLVDFKQKLVFAPVWELINHSCDAMPINTDENGLTVSEEIPEYTEILHQYSKSSPIKRLLAYGFTSKEFMVYSFSMQLNIWNGNSFVALRIKGGAIKDDTFKTERADDCIHIEGLPIANLTAKDQPYAYFVEMLKRINIFADTRQAYSEIIDYNIKSRRSLLDIINKSSSNKFLLDLNAAIELELLSLKSATDF